MITELKLYHPETLNQILAMQRASYKIEADLIGFYAIPPLVETKKNLKNCGESFFGYYIKDILAGFISYRIDGEILGICRVAVHQDYFRMGIASALLDHVLSLFPDARKAVVSTGKKNLPAASLYLKHGFIKTGDAEIEDNIFVTEYEKPLP